MKVKAVSFVAKSGTGKTALMVKVIAELKSRGYRVGAVKHDAHYFEIDYPGKDSYRMTEAGADTMLITSKTKCALVRQYSAPPLLEELIELYFSDVDIVLAEGFKKQNLPKIELHRKGLHPTLITRDDYDPNLMAVATDEPFDVDVPLLDLNNPGEVADFIVAKILS